MGATFGGNPEVAAGAIVNNMTSGNPKELLHVGADAKAGHLLAMIPGWQDMFMLGSGVAYKVATRNEGIDA